jgi:hypothetical protein
VVEVGFPKKHTLDVIRGSFQFETVAFHHAARSLWLKYAKTCQLEDAWRSLRLAQAIKHIARGKAVGDLADRSLKITDREAGAGTEQAVRVADIEAALR